MGGGELVGSGRGVCSGWDGRRACGGGGGRYVVRQELPSSCEDEVREALQWVSKMSFFI